MRTALFRLPIPSDMHDSKLQAVCARTPQSRAGRAQDLSRCGHWCRHLRFHNCNSTIPLKADNHTFHICLRWWASKRIKILWYVVGTERTASKHPWRAPKIHFTWSTSFVACLQQCTIRDYSIANYPYSNASGTRWYNQYARTSRS